MFLKIPQNSQGNTCTRVCILIKWQASAYNFVNKKETLAQVLSCEFWEIFKNAFFQRTPSAVSVPAEFFTVLRFFTEQMLSKFNENARLT